MERRRPSSSSIRGGGFARGSPRPRWLDGLAFASRTATAFSAGASGLRGGALQNGLRLGLLSSRNLLHGGFCLHTRFVGDLLGRRAQSRRGRFPVAASTSAAAARSASPVCSSRSFVRIPRAAATIAAVARGEPLPGGRGGGVPSGAAMSASAAALPQRRRLACRRAASSAASASRPGRREPAAGPSPPARLARPLAWAPPVAMRLARRGPAAGPWLPAHLGQRGMGAVPSLRRPSGCPNAFLEECLRLPVASTARQSPSVRCGSLRRHGAAHSAFLPRPPSFSISPLQSRHTNIKQKLFCTAAAAARAASRRYITRRRGSPPRPRSAAPRARVRLAPPAPLVPRARTAQRNSRGPRRRPRRRPRGGTTRPRARARQAVVVVQKHLAQLAVRLP